MNLPRCLGAALAFALLILGPRSLLAQVEMGDFPLGAHHAGRGGDTGGGRGYTAVVPLDLPPARGGLPVPVTLAVGGTRVGALGRGGDVRLSYLSDNFAFAHRRPTGASGGAAIPRRRTTLSVEGESMELLFKGRDADGEIWVPQHGHPEMLVRKIGGIWRVYAGDGLTYTFSQIAPLLFPLELYLLQRIEGPANAKVELEYDVREHQVVPPSQIPGWTVPLNGYRAVSFDMVRVRYNFGPLGSPKHEVALVYDDEDAQPISIGVRPQGVTIRKRILDRVEVLSRAAENGPLATLARYHLRYGVDADTQVRRLESVTLSGQEGTPEATQQLPVARYEYGTATTPLPPSPEGGVERELRYRHFSQAVQLPVAASSQFVSASVKQVWGAIADPLGSKYVVPQQLADVTGDGRADLVYATGGGLSVARNRPGVAGEPVLTDSTLVGSFNGGPMTKEFLDSYGAPRRFDPDPFEFPYRATDSITDTWTQLADINGDGRLDFIDASEVENTWVVYVNTPAATGPQDIKWVRREFGVGFIRQLLQARGNNLPSDHVPLMRQFSGGHVTVDRCYEWDQDAHAWKRDDSDDCDALALATGRERLPRAHYEGSTTVIAWRLLDFNGDGAIDLLMQSTAPRTVLDVQVPCLKSGTVPQPGHPGCFEPGSGDNRIAIGRHVYRVPLEGELEVSFSHRGVLPFFPDSVPRRVGGCGPGRWGTIAKETTNSYGTPYIRKDAFEDCALEDINGDGLLDSVERLDARRAIVVPGGGLVSSHVVAFLGTGGRFSDAYLVLPGATGYAPIDQCLTFNGQPTTSGSYMAASRIGYRDLTGDGIPDSIGHFLPPQPGVPDPPAGPNPALRIGTGAGFAPPIAITGDLDGVNDRRFHLSSTQNACDLSSSRTLGGAYDVDGDGRPEQVMVSGLGLDLFHVVGWNGTAPDPRALSAGLLVAIENGHGARTEIAYRSAKDDATTLHNVPHPEIVVGTVRSVQRSTGQSAETHYAYGDTQIEFDSLGGRFRSYGYGRTISMTKMGPGREEGSPLVEGVATITDAAPLAVPTNAQDVTAAFGRHLIAGRPQSVAVLGGLVSDPWTMLTTDVSSDTRVIARTQLEYQARTFVSPEPPDVPSLFCFDLVNPYEITFATIMNTCRTYGFVFESAAVSWRGRAAPPYDLNVMTHHRILEVDDFGRVTKALAGNDARRSDDDFCVETSWAVPLPHTGPFASLSWDGRVLGAMAETRLVKTNVDGACAGPALGKETLTFDGLPFGQVLNGFLTSRSAERRDTQTGVLLDPAPIRQFDAQYDALGNLRVVTSASGDGRTRTVTTTYDPFGLVATMRRVTATAAEALETLTEYDPVTLLPRAVRDPNGTRVGTIYDGFGRPVLATSTPSNTAERAIAHTRYLGFEGGDPLGRRIVEKTFTALVPLGSAASAPGRTATTTLDDHGRATRTVVALGADYTADLVADAVSYDEHGRVVFEADPFHTGENEATVYGTTHFFNTDGTLKASIRGRGRQSLPVQMFGSTDEASERYPTYFSHDFSGGQYAFGVWAPDALLTGSPQEGVQRISHTTAIGRTVSRETWSPTRRLEHVELQYNTLGNPIRVTRFRLPGGGATPPSEPVRWSFAYDSFGQVLGHEEPNTAPRDNVYSTWGELLLSKTPASPIGPTPELVQEMSYDGLGRMRRAEQRSHGAAVPGTRYEYFYDVNQSPFAALPSTNTLGRLAAIRSATSDVYFSYDAFGRSSSLVYQDPDGEVYLQTVTYDDDGAVLAVGVALADAGVDPRTNPKPETVMYGYDSARRLRTATFAQPGGGTRDLFSADEIDAFGRVRSASITKARFRAEYAEGGRRLLREQSLETPGGTHRGVFIDGYDPVGRERGRTEKDGTSGDVLAYEYDAFGRLRRGVRTGTTRWDRTFEYDALGNLQQQIDGIAGEHVRMRYSTGASGNRDQLCSIGYGVPAPTTCNVDHDANGNIVAMPTRAGHRRLEFLPSGQLRRILRDDGTEATLRYDAIGNVQELDVQGPTPDTRRDRRYGMVERRASGAGSATLLRHFPVGSAVATRRGPLDAWTIAIGDERGNRFFVDENGELAQETDYLPFGEAIGAGAQPGSATYSSQQWNHGDNLAAFGLSHLGARFFDPALGRALSADPLVQFHGASASNPYAFAFNDPINFTDPSGLCPPEGCTPSGTPAQNLGSLDAPTRPVGARRPAPPKYEANVFTTAVLGGDLPENLPENQYLVEGLGITDTERNILHRQAREQERMRRFLEEEARRCKKWPQSCPEANPSMGTQAVRAQVGGFFPGVVPPSYYLKASDRRVLHFAPASGVEYFAARQRQDAAATTVAFGRFNDRMGQVLEAVMALSGGMTNLGAAGGRVGNSLRGAAANFIQGLPRFMRGGCFSGETLVLTAEGRKPISAIDVGEKVWALDSERGAWGWHEVTDTSVRPYAGRMVAMRTAGEEILATSNHPICVEDRGDDKRPVPTDIGGDPLRCGTSGRWVEAGDIRAGDRAWGTGEPLAVAPLPAADENRLVYNLQVAGAHAYVVGTSETLVHNNNCPFRYQVRWGPNVPAPETHPAWNVHSADVGRVLSKLGRNPFPPPGGTSPRYVGPSNTRGSWQTGGKWGTLTYDVEMAADGSTTGVVTIRTFHPAPPPRYLPGR